MRALVCCALLFFFEGEKKIRDLPFVDVGIRATCVRFSSRQNRKKKSLIYTPTQRGGVACFFFDYIISILHNDKF